MISTDAILLITQEIPEIVLHCQIAPDSPSTAEMYQTFIDRFLQYGADIALVPESFGTADPGHVRFRVVVTPASVEKKSEHFIVERKKPIPSIEPLPGTPGGVKPTVPSKPPIVTRAAPTPLRVPLKLPLTPTEILKAKIEKDKKK